MERPLKIPPDIVAKYGPHDADVGQFLTGFDEKPGSKIIVVGSHDEASANMMAAAGYDVLGVDLREYDKDLPACNYSYLRGDFCQLAAGKLNVGYGMFDAFVALSALEHFGLGSYQEGQMCRHYDIVAMRYAWDLLKEGGRAYITVPFACRFFEMLPHWRVYDFGNLVDRLVQDFMLLFVDFFMSADGRVCGAERKIGDVVSMAEAVTYPGHPPNLSVLAVMEKRSINRMAPDGR